MILIDMEMPKRCGDCPFYGLESAGNGMYYDFCEGGKFILCDPDNNIDESCPMKPFTPPAADVVEVKHGHWVLSDGYEAADHCRWNVWTCSECGYRRKAGWEHTEDGRKPRAKYCENCMTKMDGGADDGSNA